MKGEVGELKVTSKYEYEKNTAYKHRWKCKIDIHTRLLILVNIG